MAWLSAEDSEEDVRITVEEKIEAFIEDLNYFVYWDLDQLRRYLDRTQKKWKTELEGWRKK